MIADAADFPTPPCLPFDPFAYARRASTRLEVTGVDGRPVAVGGDEVIKVAITRFNLGRIAHKVDRLGDFKPDFVVEDSPLVAVDPREPLPAGLPADALVTVRDGLDVPVITAFRLLAARLAAAGCPAPMLLKDTLHPAVSLGTEDVRPAARGFSTHCCLRVPRWAR
jgi:(E)-4-hydroxy-3-methylbut-2-enyl-diphosphate synthase